VHHRDAQRGFTVVELMIVVAIIAVLAAVVVPTFMKESTRGRNKSEISPMFAELGTREEQYKQENGSYLPAPACPTAASNSGTDMTAAACSTTAGQPWVSMRVSPSETTLHCSYVIATGLAGISPAADTAWPSAWSSAHAVPSPGTTLATGWYFVHATCPENEYFTASWDSKIRSKDGK
jgi:prepilin-type N-terminal cleavage/methylation domain-containing protein